MKLSLVCCLAWCLTSGAAAQATSVFSVPCQSREEFTSRLRALLTDPQRAEAVLERFSVDIAAGSDGSWTLTVSEPANPKSQPRTLRQATCSELTEAAVLIVSAWADEPPPPRAAVVPPPPPAPPFEPQDPPRDEASEIEPRMQFGASFRADGAIHMMPSATFGGSVAVWFLTADRLTLTSLGVSAWPSHYVEDADILRYQEYERPLWYLFVQQARYLVQFPPVSLGLFGQVSIGSRRADEGGSSELTFGVAVGPDVRWAITDWFAARAQLGVFIVHSASESMPGVATLSLDLTIK
ncbi:MAG TPA: hypothetical protein VJR89_22270 [Polyangiales bacterium]|nr:hypothetical protein [Polyangiales bacterium]